MSDLEEFVEKPKSEVLLKPAEAMRPSGVSAEIEALETAGAQLAAAHLVSSLLLKRLLSNISASLGAIWTPVSMFLSIVRSATIAHLKQEVLWERIANLREALVQYCRYANQVVASSDAALKQAEGSVASFDDPAWREAYERLRLYSETLVELERLGARIKAELSLLPKLRAELLKQRVSIPAQRAAAYIEDLERGEVGEFTISLNKVRSMIRRME